MVWVVPRVPDGDVSKETAIRPQDIVRPGPHLPPLSYTNPCPPVPSPWSPTWLEVRRHIFKSFCCQFRRNVLSSPNALRLRQFHVEVSRRQQFGSLGPLFERGNDTFYCRGVVGGEVTSHDVPPPLPRRHLESDNVGPKSSDGLHRKMGCWPVKHWHSAAVSARRVYSDDAIPNQPAGVDSVSYLGLLKDSQVYFDLGHPPQRRLQSPVTFVTNVIGAKPNRHPPPCRNFGTPIYPLPRDAFSSLDLADLPACACLPFLRSWSHSAPASLPSPFPSPFTSPLYPLPTPCHSPWHGVLRSALTQIGTFQYIVWDCGQTSMNIIFYCWKHMVPNIILNTGK